MRHRKQRPTLRMLADKAGVSVGAASRALSGDTRISDATRAKINALASELGYSPNRAGLGLRTGRTHVIAALVYRHDEILGFGPSWISGISKATKDTPYQINVLPMYGDEDNLAPFQQIIHSGAADGLLFTRTRPDDKRVRLLMEAGYPFVCHGRTEIQGHAWFDFDNEGFGRHAIRAMSHAGRRKIAVIMPPRRFMFQRFLFAGISDEAEKLGIALDLCEDVSLDTPSDELETYLRQRFLASRTWCDGIICPGETSAIVAAAVVSDQGMVPQKDVLIIAKQTTPLFEKLRPRFPTVCEDVTAAGEIMTKMLIRLIDGTPPDVETYLQVAS
ncbi:LacI family DNA-binding transcriptional regulator [Agrobacterium tumefaciens]|uniref:LacI family DNA-binding transcriptional regulator n=1 Tax=Agrobacterium tumefaciens TaxID=358 RepID=A0A4D7YPN3_AGRTU|nr:LacI family DNA-binding transcriptional regulator [Agrobacterium tumefaciens]QCL97707.1 LacI family DNA-binding transcriptional regulator [Agrobacterium tumefaciens]